MLAPKDQTILIVDDSAMNRALLADMIGDGYNIIEAENGAAAIAALQTQTSAISLVLLDIVMPEMDGFEVLAIMNKNGWIKDIPVIMVSSETAASTVERAYDLGAVDFINRPFDANIVRRRVTNTLMLYAKQKVLVGMVADQVYEREKSTNLMISILGHIVEFRNGESGLHVLHVNIITELLLNQIMRKSARYKLTPSDISTITMASSLHDIGKIAIPEEILNKPGRLTDEEFERMKTHSAIGADMLENLPFKSDEPLVKTAYEICRWHHERFDGKGYPDGLVGDEIPLSAQVVSLADVYDALTSERVYKKAYPHDVALKMILDGSCGAFDPFLLECLVDIADVLEDELTLTSLSDNIAPAIPLHTQTGTSAEMSASSRTLELLDYERMKYHFFASMSNEIQYEYTEETNLMVFSDWGNRGLGIPELVENPLEDETLAAVFGAENIKEMQTRLRATTIDNPIVKFDFEAPMRGEPRWCHSDARAIWSDDIEPRYLGCIGKIVDVHEQKMNFADLHYRAMHDSLTGTVNRSAAQKAISDRLENHSDGKLVLVLADLDFFKQANDTRGHQFGDNVLKHFSERLGASVREGDIVARVGGDEFLLCLHCVADPKPVIKRIHDFIMGEFEGFPISTSFGVAVAEPHSSISYEDLFRLADIALYQTKRSGRGNFTFFTDIDVSTLEDLYQTMPSSLSEIDEGTPAEEETNDVA